MDEQNKKIADKAAHVIISRYSIDQRTSGSDQDTLKGTINVEFTLFCKNRKADKYHQFLEDLSEFLKHRNKCLSDTESGRQKIIERGMNGVEELRNRVEQLEKGVAELRRAAVDKLTAHPYGDSKTGVSYLRKPGCSIDQDR